jgi:hypothetical protein
LKKYRGTTDSLALGGSAIGLSAAEARSLLDDGGLYHRVETKSMFLL